MTRSRKILIADDDEKLLKALSIRLELEGYEVIRVTDCYNALARTREERPDLLLLDINMPAGDGFMVHERMREIDCIDDTPVIYLTGDTSERLDKIAEELGAVALFHKPFNMRELINTIHHVVGPRAA